MEVIKRCGFYATIFCASFLIYVYPFEVVRYLIQGDAQSAIYLLTQTIISALLVIYYLRSSSTFLPIKLFVYEGMGLGFISFWIANFALIMNNWLSFPSEFIGYSTILIISLLFIFSHFSTKFLNIKEIKLTSNKVKNNYCIVFLSDVHLGSNSQSHLRRIIAKIHKINPDIVLIGGDLIDSSSFQPSQLDILRELSAKIYFVTGNHEYYLKNSRELLYELKEHEMEILDNENIDFKELNIIGISDNTLRDEKIIFINNLIKNEKFNICMVHQPSIWDDVSENIDVMLSGHTHKGQIFPFNFLVKLKFKYIYGEYQLNNGTLFVSSGAGTWGPRMRLGSFNEILKINLSTQ